VITRSTAGVLGSNLALWAGPGVDVGHPPVPNYRLFRRCFRLPLMAFGVGPVSGASQISGANLSGGIQNRDGRSRELELPVASSSKGGDSLDYFLLSTKQLT
jgi:hypothetical protein